MPYEGEFAEYGPLRRVVSDERIKTILSRAKSRPEVGQSSPLARISFADVAPSQFQPYYVVAIDGSNISVPIEKGYPGAEIGYVTVASVVVNLQLLRELSSQRPVDPVKFRQTEQPESLDAVLPGCNIVVDNEISARSSLRRVIFELLGNRKLFDEGETLLDTYEALLAHKPDEEQRCPYYNMYEDNCWSDDRTYRRGNGEYPCQCISQRPLYSTDALRVHERLRPDSTNAGIFTEIMQVLERLWLVHILRGFEQLGYLQLLRSIAFVLDGPLAVFGQPAWISQAIKNELQRINTIALQETGGHDALIIGIEKSGAFVTHMEQLVETKRESDSIRTMDDSVEQLAQNHLGNSLIPPQTACLLTDDYIKQNIVYSESTRPYGRQTYFGRKFFYRTKSGAQIVASLPFLKEDDEDLSRAEPGQYPRLADALALFDQLVSSRYPNSLAPVIAAHAEASIPLNLGRKVLEKMAKELMQSPS